MPLYYIFFFRCALVYIICTRGTTRLDKLVLANYYYNKVIIREHRRRGRESRFPGTSYRISRPTRAQYATGRSPRKIIMEIIMCTK